MRFGRNSPIRALKKSFPDGKLKRSGNVESMVEPAHNPQLCLARPEIRFVGRTATRFRVTPSIRCRFYKCTGYLYLCAG